ncbi:hypothetical protein ABZ281_02655 [Streptomyces sp. NPDC006265]|uniref:hypothetical protein n=1 Tax=Streptomyces sp. NPDC006265 TaxID=3156740 RepID=UPI0033A57ECE
MSDRTSTPDELWDKFRDLLNEMDAAGLAVNFGSQMGSETNWYSLPYASNDRTQRIEVIYDREKEAWKRYQR